MPRFRQPLMLQEMLYSLVSQAILSNQPKTEEHLQLFYKHRDDFRALYTSLPSPIPGTVLEHVQFLQKKSGKLKDFPLSLYVTELLLSQDTRHFKILIPKQHKSIDFTRLLNVLIDQGKHLISFQLFGSFSLHDTPMCLKQEEISLMKSLLASANNLVILSLQIICTDAILKLIGEHCTELQRLDVTLSSSISDKGLHYLTQNILKVPLTSEEIKPEWKSTFWNLPQLYPPLSSLWTEETLNETQVPNNNFTYVRTRSSLCSTLKELIISSSPMITVNGILVLLELIPNLQSVNYCINSHFFNELNRKWISSGNQEKGLQMPETKLTWLQLGSLSQSILEVIKVTCPLLSKLWCLLPEETTLSSISCFSNLELLYCMQDVTGINLETPLERHACIQKNELHKFLIGSGIQLKRLYLKSTLLREVDLRFLLQECPHLELLFLSLDCKITWTTPLTIKPCDSLIKVTIRKYATSYAIRNLLLSAPMLRELRVECIVEVTQNFILELCKLPNHPRLKTFKVGNGEIFENTDTLERFLDSYNEVKTILKLPTNISLEQTGFAFDVREDTNLCT